MGLNEQIQELEKRVTFVEEKADDLLTLLTAQNETIAKQNKTLGVQNTSISELLEITKLLSGGGQNES